MHPPGVLKLFMHITNATIGQWIITAAVKQAKAILILCSILLSMLHKNGIFRPILGVRQQHQQGAPDYSVSLPLKLGQRSLDFVKVLMLVNYKITDDLILWPLKAPRAERGRYTLGSAYTCGAKLHFRFHWLFSWTCILVPEHKDQFSMNPSLLTDLSILTLQGDMSLISD